MGIIPAGWRRGRGLAPRAGLFSFRHPSIFSYFGRKCKKNRRFFFRASLRPGARLGLSTLSTFLAALFSPAKNPRRTAILCSLSQIYTALIPQNSGSYPQRGRDGIGREEVLWRPKNPLPHPPKKADWGKAGNREPACFSADRGSGEKEERAAPSAFTSGALECVSTI